MTLLVGAMLGAGVLLVLSPWLWPARRGTSSPATASALTRLIKELRLTARVVKDPKPGMVITLACPAGRIVFGGAR